MSLTEAELRECTMMALDQPFFYSKKELNNIFSPNLWNTHSNSNRKNRHSICYNTDNYIDIPSDWK